MSAQQDLFDYACEELKDVYVNHDRGYVKFLITGDVAAYPIRVWTQDSLAQVLLTLPIRIPEGARSDVAEAICSINYSLTMGGFELDFRDGEVRFVVSTFLEEDSLPRSIWQNLMSVGVSTVERFASVLCSMVYGNESAQEALSTIGFFDESE